jgi:hypothetical protein
MDRLFFDLSQRAFSLSARLDVPERNRRDGTSHYARHRATRPRGDLKLPTRQAEKRTTKCRISADFVSSSEFRNPRIAARPRRRQAE